jgi:hypothetical protein
LCEIPSRSAANEEREHQALDWMHMIYLAAFR